MGILNDEFERVLQQQFGMAELSRRAVLLAAKSRGVSIGAEHIEAFNEACERSVAACGSECVLPEAISDIGISVLDIERAMEQILEESGAAAEAAVEKVLNVTPQNVLSSLYCDAPRALAENRSMQRGFERRLRTTWRDAFDRLEMLTIVARESGEQAVKDFREPTDDDEVVGSVEEAELFDALVRLHVRACRTASEVLCLLRGGFADGANARWRSLHELAVVAMFLVERRSDVPQRYLRHSAVDRLKGARQYQSYCGSLGQDPFTTSEIAGLERECSEALAEFGESFKNEYGWAANALGILKPTFADIEKSIDMDKWRPYFKMACHAVHAGSQGLIFSLGLPKGSEVKLLAGASNAGLADPGHCTAISLTLVSAALFTARPQLDSLVSSKVMLQLCDDIGEAFLRTHKEVEAKVGGSMGDDLAEIDFEDEGHVD
jgi:hypothetical protein